MIRRWQAESLLCCRVPHLRPYDARILVACGITDPDQLLRLDADELLRRVEEFAATSTGQVLLRSGNRYELSRLTDWIRAARTGRVRASHARRRNPHPRHASGGNGAPARRPDRVVRPGHDRDERVRSGETTREPRRSTTRPRAASDPVVLKLDPRPPAGDSIWKRPTPSGTRPPSARGWPSGCKRSASGPWTTSCEPIRTATATRLNSRRITAETIRQWQQQTVLACRIPELRGHDAQILVACGVVEPERLAQMDAAALWKQVEAFAASAEGKRIIRQSKAPDRDEVADWIRWAAHARSLKAA